MKVLYVWDADYPWDVRVEKICGALMEGGHEVHVASRNLQKRAVYENIDGLHVHRLKSWSNDKLNYVTSFPLFCSPVWKSFLDLLIKLQSIDLIIVRDLPMAVGGIWAGRRAGVPVILDMAEDYVSMIRDIWVARKFEGFNLLVRNPYFARMVERYTFKHVDQILVVVDEARNVVIKGGGDAARITLVGNTPDLAMNSGAYEEASDIVSVVKKHYSVIYTGGIQLGRGLQIVFEAIPKIVEQIPDFKFVVIGDGYARDGLKDLIRKMGIQEHVLWLGWLPHAELRRYINVCRMGIVPHYVSDHVNTTIPNKLFDYMACGLPVLTSDATPMKRIVDEEKCGKAFSSGNASELANALLSMRGHEEELGENGRRAVLRKYNWREDKGRLLALISQFEKTTSQLRRR